MRVVVCMPMKCVHSIYTLERAIEETFKCSAMVYAWNGDLTATADTSNPEVLEKVLELCPSCAFEQ